MGKKALDVFLFGRMAQLCCSQPRAAQCKGRAETGYEELCQQGGTRAPAKTAAISEVDGEGVNENPGTVEPLVPGF